MNQSLKFNFSIPLILSGCLSVACSASAQELFFQQGNQQIRKSQLDGSGLTVLLTTPIKGPLSLDVPNSKMYWSDATTIRRANFDGSGLEDVLAGQNLVREIAVDPGNSQFYWTDEADGVIRRSDYNGANVTTLVSGLSVPFGIELDVPNNKMYWADGSQIQTANLDGTNAAVVLDNGSGGIHSLAIDPLLNKLYWAHTGAGPVSTIYRANLDGTTLETLIVGASPSSMRSIALDLENGQLYIDEGYSQEIQRANLDGTNLQTVLGDAQSPSVLPTGPAAVPEPATWLLVLLGLGFLSRCRRIGQRGR